MFASDNLNKSIYDCDITDRFFLLNYEELHWERKSVLTN